MKTCLLLLTLAVLPSLHANPIPIVNNSSNPSGLLVTLSQLTGGYQTGTSTSERSRFFGFLDDGNGNTPAPKTLLLMGSGFALLGFAGRKLRHPER